MELKVGQFCINGTPEECHNFIALLMATTPSGASITPLELTEKERGGLKITIINGIEKQLADYQFGHHIDQPIVDHTIQEYSGEDKLLCFLGNNNSGTVEAIIKHRLGERK